MTIPDNSLRKAVLLLLSLPERQATELIGRLEPQQAAAVTAAMKEIGPYEGAEQEVAVRECAARIAEHRPPQTVPLQFLHHLDADAVFDLIADEHPQTIALVLCHLQPQQAAAVLAELPPEGQLSVVCRMATMGEASPEAIADLELGLRRRMADPPCQPTVNCGVASVVRMLNLMQPASERRLLAHLAEADPQLVEEIHRAMFGIDVTEYDECDVEAAAG
jgi:flagellar motor switch protein FliG